MSTFDHKFYLFLTFGVYDVTFLHTVGLRAAPQIYVLPWKEKSGNDMQWPRVGKKWIIPSKEIVDGIASQQTTDDYSLIPLANVETTRKNMKNDIDLAWLDENKSFPSEYPVNIESSWVSKHVNVGKNIGESETLPPFKIGRREIPPVI